MSHLSRRATPVVALLAVATVIAGCSSSSKTDSGGQPTMSASLPSASSTSATASAGPPNGSSSGGGPTMSAPHIACSQGPVTKTYDGTQTNPVELCVQSRTVVRLMIKPPAGQTWALPTATPAGNLVTHASRSGTSVLMQLSAIRKGTVTVTVPHTAWRLRIAVI